jgi:hypothetical protein
MTGKHHTPRASRGSHRDVFFHSERERGESEGVLGRLEELDAVALEEVAAWRIDQVLRATRLPRD